MRFLLPIFFLSAIVLAQPKSELGGLPGAPLRMGFGSMGIAQGNARIADRLNPMTGYYNPALLPFQGAPTATVSVGFLSLDRNLNFLSYALPVKPAAGISLGIINAGVSDIQGRDADGVKTSVLSTSENAFLLSFGTRLDSHLSVGISTKILYYHLYTNLNSTTVGFDIGIAAIITDEWTVGASLHDLGSKYKWDTSQLYGIYGNSTIDRFPLRKTIGVSYSPSSIPLRVNIEMEHLAGMIMVRGGSYYQLVPAFGVSAGIDQWSFSDNLLPKPSFGFVGNTEVASHQVSLAYAFVLEPYAPGAIHVLSLGVVL